MDRRPPLLSRPTFSLVEAGLALLFLSGVACAGKATSSPPAATGSPAAAATSPGYRVGSRSLGGSPDVVRQEDADVQARTGSSAPPECRSASRPPKHGHRRGTRSSLKDGPRTSTRQAASRRTKNERYR